MWSKGPPAYPVTDTVCLRLPLWEDDLGGTDDHNPPCVRKVVAFTLNNSKHCLYTRNRFMEYTPSAPHTEVNFLSSLDFKRCLT
jgi:hypothetical protein